MIDLPPLIWPNQGPLVIEPARLRDPWSAAQRDIHGGVTKARLLVADPPWRFGDELPGESRGAAKQFPTMSVEEIKVFPLPIFEENAYLFLWRVSAMVEEAYQVARAWGFVPKAEMVWCKRTRTGKPWFGMGRHTRASHETCIIATRGKPRPLSRSIRSTFEAPVPSHRVNGKLQYRHSA